MQFIKNGPDIPESLLEAHEDGQVVFFCGAGISYPAGLPGFGGLVDRIYPELSVRPSATERKALENSQFDTALGLLERNNVGGRLSVRKALQTALTPDFSLPNACRTQRALLKLGRNRNGHTRLVTTNFDRIFEKVIQDDSLTVPTYSAPLLPVPKNRWDGLVYLHGLLPEFPDDATLNRLVVSSGDFGLAYLVERWAARFVSDLFRNFTVCFVGYSINDPILRYMMDALAADGLMGESSPKAYAFGNFYPDSGYEDAEREWQAKYVTPVLYKGRRCHEYLHQTLNTWADSYRDGQLAKQAIVGRYCQLKPSATTRQDDYVGRLKWALSDKTGLPAKKFAEAEPAPSLEWLQFFLEDDLGYDDLRRFGVELYAKPDDELKFSFLCRPTSQTCAATMVPAGRLVDLQGGFDEVMTHMARWLARHIHDPELFLWVVSVGGTLHSQMRFYIERNLANRAPPTGIREVVAGFRTSC